MLIPLVAILSSIALPIILGVYVAIRTKNINHIERMELIKQGIIPPDSPSASAKPAPNKYRSLRNGILLIGIGLGLIISLWISYELDLREDQTFFVVASLVLLLLGLGYLLFYLLVRNNTDLD